MRHFQDIEVRRKAWNALSNLFLDTDVSSLYDYMAKLLAETSYSLVEIEKIYVEEVYPICKWNMYSVAGEWVGFDLEWLEKKICNSRKPLPWGWNRFFAKLSLRLSSHWSELIRRTVKLREANDT